MSDVLTVSKIQEASGKPHPVEVPEWGGTVMVRKTNTTARDIFLYALFDGTYERAQTHIHARVVHECMVQPRFASLEDLEAQGSDGINTIFRAIVDLSNLTGSVEEAEGNSEETPDDSSDSDSQDTSDGASSKSSSE